MSRLKFELFLSEHRDRGLCSRFTDGNGLSTVSWWSAPPGTLDNASLGYLQDRHDNIKTKEHAAFIRSEFNHQKANDFRHVGMNVYERIRPEPAVEIPAESPAAAHADARAERVRKLSMQVMVAQGENFSAMLYRNGEQIGNIGSDNRKFVINLAIEPTLSETVDILQFAENLSDAFHTHRFEMRVRSGWNL